MIMYALIYFTKNYGSFNRESFLNLIAFCSIFFFSTGPQTFRAVSHVIWVVVYAFVTYWNRKNFVNHYGDSNYFFILMFGGLTFQVFNWLMKQLINTVDPLHPYFCVLTFWSELIVLLMSL